MMLAAPEFVVTETVELLDQIEIAAKLQQWMLTDRMMRGEKGAEIETRHDRLSCESVGPVGFSGARGEMGPAKQRAAPETARRSHGASGFMRTQRRTPSKSSVKKPTVFKVLLAPAT